ncbi:MAG TPA: serine/threonine-protein kinase [Segetibacter sp.]
MKYKLSSFISISEVDRENVENLPDKFASGYFLLYNEERDKEYLINSTIKYYIDKFTPTPATQEEVLQLVKNDLNTDSADVEKICVDFFKFLVKKKILIPEDQVEQAVLEETLFKQGDTINNYIIDDVIADKNNLDIYLATDTTTNDKVVIKLLNNKKVSDPIAFQQELVHLKREYSLLQSVNHSPSINHAIDFKIQDDQFAYITLEYINGTNLSRYFKTTPTLTEEDCLDLIKQIIKAFSLLHECNLIHGDIHPSNIMVCEDNTIKIIDLGLSRTIEVDKNEVLKHGGVTFYMPPERITISSVKKFYKAPDLYSDVYQLGLIMYLIIYNTTPFTGFIWEELAQNIMEQEITYPDVSFHGFNASTHLKEIINICTAKQPTERYTNAKAILDDLNERVFKQQQQFIN